MIEKSSIDVMKPEEVSAALGGLSSIFRRAYPVLTDWGFTHIQGRRKNLGGIVGTPFYMAPEQLRLQGGGLQRRSEIFSLGVVGYTLATGRHPYVDRKFNQGGSADDFLHAYLYEDNHAAGDVAGMPSDYYEVLEPALRIHPFERYQTMRDFAAALYDYEQQGTPDLHGDLDEFFRRVRP